MPDPITGAVAAALLKMVTDLATMINNGRHDSREAKQLLGGILLELRFELELNWQSLRDAFYGSRNERLRKEVHGSCGAVLGQALLTRASLRDAVGQAYGQMTDGFCVRLTAPSREPGTDETIGRVWNAVGRALVEVERFLDDEGLTPRRPNGRDCAFKRFGELIEGWRPEEQHRVATAWREFVAAARENRVRRYTLDEFGAVTMYAEPARELELRVRAKREYGGLHSFELEPGIFEYWMRPDLRVIYAGSGGNLVVLDIVPLWGRQEDGWTPRWYVQRARCRLDQYLSRQYHA